MVGMPEWLRAELRRGDRAQAAQVVIDHVSVDEDAARLREIIATRIECTLCGNPVVNGDCGTPHRAGSAQMIIRRMA